LTKKEKCDNIYMKVRSMIGRCNHGIDGFQDASTS